MKNKLSIITIMLLSFFTRTAQSQTHCEEQCLADQISLNTGYDHAANLEYNVNTRDEYWQVVQVPTGAGANVNNNVPYCAYVIPATSYWPDDFPSPALSQWISPYPTGANTFNNWTGGCPGTPTDNPYRLQRKFEICSSQDSVELRLDLTILVDDIIEFVWIDGTKVGFGSCGAGHYTWGGRETYSPTFKLAPGTHTISLDLRNVFSIVMGVNMQGTLTVTDGTGYLVRSSCMPKNICTCLEKTDLKIDLQNPGNADLCDYIATATAYGSNIIGYEWYLPGQAPFINYNTGNTDVVNFSLPNGSTGTVSVIIHAVRSEFSPGTSPCCSEELFATVTCGDENPHEGGLQQKLINGSVNGLTDPSTTNFTIFPNPTTDEVKINSNGNEMIKTVEICDMAGKVLSNHGIGGKWNSSVSLKNYKPGAYMIRINGQYAKVVVKE